jgi:putative hydrolase of HD superfamily
VSTGQDGLLAFLRATGALKALPRQGWVDRGVRAPESVADHTYRNAMMAWILGAAAGLDTARLVKLMLVHDLPEVEAGDATPYGGIAVDAEADLADVVARWRELVTPEALAQAREEKHRVEAAAMAHLTGALPVALRDELRALWTEYAERRTPEARFAAQIDKLEALLQALEYRDAGQPADVENFLQSAREAVTDPVLFRFLGELEAAAADQGHPSPS